MVGFELKEEKATKQNTEKHLDTALLLLLTQSTEKYLLYSELNYGWLQLKKIENQENYMILS